MLLACAFFAVSESARIEISFGRAGPVIREPSGAALSLSFAGAGRAGRLACPRAATLIGDERRIEYDRGIAREWFEIDGAQIEHGFTLHERPSGPAEAPVELRASLAGELRAFEVEDGLEFRDAEGVTRLAYVGLFAFDAGGRALDGRILLDGDELVLAIDDAGARYPLTIDPTLVTFDGQFGLALTNFGGRLALSGDTAVVGCYVPPSWSGNKSVTFWDRTTAGWSSMQTVIDGNGRFGYGVGIDGDIAAVGAPHIDDRLFVYERLGGTWTQVLEVGPFDHDWFGYSVVVQGRRVAVSAPYTLGFPYPVTVYEKVGGAWVLADELDSGIGVYGQSLDLDAPRVVAGDVEWGGNRGKVAVYLLPSLGGSATPEDEFTPGVVVANDRFGHSVAIDGDRLVAGAPYFDAGGLGGAGAAFVYERNGSDWTLVQRLEASGSVPSARLGSSVAIDDDRLFVGGAGFVLQFERIFGTWTEVSRIEPPVGTPSLEFGASLALDGARLLVGAPDVQQVFAYDLAVLPSPASYCTAKVNSLGCTPVIAANGYASAALLQPFWITAGQVISHKAGLLLYGTQGPHALPFQGGFLCIAPPRRRTPMQSSGGNPPPDDCSGTFALDFNALIRSGLDPALVPGARVDAQYWMRDGAASFQVGLTDAIEFWIAP